jgi:DNA-binding MarR family transcriptional regulator
MTGTRWLSPDEQRVWRSFLGACQALFAAVDAQLQREAGLPHPYYEILVRLSEAPGHALRMSQLAEASASSKSRISHAVARLEERGWVCRLDCPTDRRGQIAQLTEEGYAALAAAAPGHVEQVRRSLFDVLTAEQVRQLGAIAEAVARRGEGRTAPGCGWPGASGAAGDGAAGDGAAGEGAAARAGSTAAADSRAGDEAEARGDGIRRQS